MIKIGHAAHNELGQVVGGQHGDQNGQEVYITNWYYFGQTEVYRWKSRDLAERFANVIKQMCTNDDIGYNQDCRWMLNDFLRTHGFDINKINTKLDCDCSSFTGAGINATMRKEVVSGAVQTGTMEKYIMPSGLFEKLTGDQYCRSDGMLKVGDIINCPFKHVVIALEDGSNAPYAESMTAKVLGAHKVGETLKASDFEVIVNMSNGSVLKNPAGWFANPLKLEKETTDIMVGYMAARAIVTVHADNVVKPVKLNAIINGTHKIGDTLTAKDFTIKVVMSDGTTIINPPGWSATPLTLTSTKNAIKVVYKGLATSINVDATDWEKELQATVNGLHKIGTTLTAKDFTITVIMASGEKVVNPNNWSASPLKLTSKKNAIAVKYKKLSTTTVANAV